MTVTFFSNKRNNQIEKHSLVFMFNRGHEEPSEFRVSCSVKNWLGKANLGVIEREHFAVCVFQLLSVFAACLRENPASSPLVVIDFFSITLCQNYFSLIDLHSSLL